MVNVMVNGVPVAMPEGSTILEATEAGRLSGPHPLLSEGYQ